LPLSFPDDLASLHVQSWRFLSDWQWKTIRGAQNSQMLSAKTGSIEQREELLCKRWVLGYVIVM